MARQVLVLMVGFLLLVTLACGGSDNNSGSKTQAGLQITNPRTVPTATPWTTPPTPIFVDAAQTGATPTASRNTYVVKSGDTPAAIAERLGVSLQDLMRANNITDPTKLQVGQELTVPGQQAGATPTPRPGTTSTPTGTPRPGATPTPTPRPGGQQTYTVKSGDNLSKIAQDFGVTVADIQRANNLGDSTLIFAGQQLIIPATTRSPSPTPSRP